MIYTILVAHVADPLPPLASLAGLADLNFTRVKQGSFPIVQFAWGLLMYEGIISLSATERINAMYSFHSKE